MWIVAINAKIVYSKLFYFPFLYSYFDINILSNNYITHLIIETCKVALERWKNNKYLSINDIDVHRLDFIRTFSNSANFFEVMNNNLDL